MDIATYENDRWTVRNTGQMIILRSKLVPAVAIAFPHWDAVIDAMCLLVRGLSPEMRREFLGWAFGMDLATAIVGRSLRLAIVQQQYDAGNLTEEQAREVLSGPLTPGDDTTIVDDSDQLVVGS